MSEISIKNSIFEEEKEAFSYDENALKDFKRFIRDQGINFDMDDIFLLGFLRARKFDLKRSLQLLKNYFNVRIEYPQYFKNHLPSKLGRVLDMNIVRFLPILDQDGSYIYLYQFRNWDTSIASGVEVLRAIMLVLDFQLNFHRAQEKKIVCIIDSAGLALTHFYHYPPRVVHSMVTFILKDSYQLRYKEVHFVNLNIIIKAILSVMFPLLSSKLRKRFHIHSDMESLHKFVNPDCLPSEFGGNLPDFDPTEATNMLKSNEELFQRREEYVKLYEEQRNKNFTEGTFRYIREDVEDEKIKKFMEKSEEKFQRHADNPEAFIAALKEDSEFEFTHF
ncbi:alpha-tocopherol transfer protein-like [Centruroides sculpturatus]|uniref:alpha-tocopherol transfer protein-like n=1 Tax=Centruroides sculpturatus TaxID=218467 RepID=UPI000C6E7A22|nr:alpha-tocopherol transfer protein-like [Centruroides sculpturatus]